MEGPIAIIGWGSLIWELENLVPHVQGMWQMRAGPELPLEFSRVSPKRKKALAVCIDPMDGVPCYTSVIASKRQTIAEARTDLARRERASDGFIGAFDASSGQSWGRPQVAFRIANWCRATGWRGAVWTDLHPTFTAATGLVFSAQAGADYLRTLDEEGLAEAVRYIERAPALTNTRLRRHLRDDPWWQEQVARIMGDGTARRDGLRFR